MSAIHLRLELLLFMSPLPSRLPLFASHLLSALLSFTLYFISLWVSAFTTAVFVVTPLLSYLFCLGLHSAVNGIDNPIHSPLVWPCFFGTVSLSFESVRPRLKAKGCNAYHHVSTYYFVARYAAVGLDRRVFQNT